MKNSAKIIQNFTIRDIAMLVLSLILFIIIGLATCNKHDHSHQKDTHFKETQHADKPQGNDAVQKISDVSSDTSIDKQVDALTAPDDLNDEINAEDTKPIDTASNTATTQDSATTVDSQTTHTADVTHAEPKTQHEMPVETSEVIVVPADEPNTSDTPETEVTAEATEINTVKTVTNIEDEDAELNATFDELLDSIQEEHEATPEAVDTLTEALKAYAQEEHEATPETVDAPSEKAPDVLLDDTEIEDDTTTETSNVTSKVVSLFKHDKTEPAEDVVEDALLVDVEDTPQNAPEAGVKEATNAELAACTGDDSKVDSLEDWETYLKAKIKKLLIEDEKSHCIDVLLEELYLSSNH